MSDMIWSDIAWSYIIGRPCRSILHTTRTFILPHHANNDCRENLYFSISNVLHLLVPWRGTENCHNHCLLTNLLACHACSIGFPSSCSPAPVHWLQHAWAPQLWASGLPDPMRCKIKTISSKCRIWFARTLPGPKLPPDSVGVSCTLREPPYCHIMQTTTLGKICILAFPMYFIFWSFDGHGKLSQSPSLSNGKTCCLSSSSWLWLSTCHMSLPMGSLCPQRPFEGSVFVE